MQDKRLYGFPLNMPYNDDDMEKVWEQVKNTEIHLTKDETAEFALTVQLFDYPHDIYSVWVFLVVLIADEDLS